MVNDNLDNNHSCRCCSFRKSDNKIPKEICQASSPSAKRCNSMALAFRLLILVGAIAALVRLGGLPSEWFVAFSALSGAAVGFASTQTIGNFIAGLYLLATRPFKVEDYVRLGTSEGIVQEITINYTKILTIGYNVVSISNLQVMSRDMTNFSYESEDHKNTLLLHLRNRLRPQRLR
jgi:hypothetical protein